MKRTHFYILLLVFVAFCSQSCKVAYSFSGADVPPEAETFSVNYFQVTAPLANPSYSQKFTEKLKDQLLTQTRLSLTKSNGDLQFSGTVIGYEVVPNAVQGDQTAALNRLRIKVRVNYVNSFDEKKNFEREFEKFADFPAATSFTTVEEGLINDINNQLIQDIFNASLGNW